MPTSKGLSHSTYSFPPRAWTIGAWTLSARARSESWAPAQPRPARMVTRSPPLTSAARASSSRTCGRTTGRPGNRPAHGRDGLRRRLTRRHVPRDDHDGDAAESDRGTDGDVEGAGHLGRVGHHLAVDAALAEELLGMGLLEVAAADLGAGDLRGDREHRYPRAVAVEEAVDQVEIAGTAASRADREATCQVRLGARGEGGRLLVAHVDPVDLTPLPEGFGDGVETVAHHPVDAAYAGGLQGLGEEIGDGVDAHGTSTYRPPPVVSTTRFIVTKSRS